MAFAFAPRVVRQLVIGVASCDEVRQNLEAVRLVPSVPSTLWDAAR
jgi:hypothetical protein